MHLESAIANHHCVIRQDLMAIYLTLYLRGSLTSQTTTLLCSRFVNMGWGKEIEKRAQTRRHHDRFDLPYTFRDTFCKQDQNVVKCGGAIVSNQLLTTVTPGECMNGYQLHRPQFPKFRWAQRISSVWAPWGRRSTSWRLRKNDWTVFTKYSNRRSKFQPR